ncbi:Uncharacterized protein PECH_001910 [Penicillium ucsense]|uniref:Uncharacterized protein n=1 Tax=Penicillium ucsense TaxID=2839758 RepID=A0A8J8W2G1_9EURO|nr:Uncharacterized protein PECM_006080 [Penicillium ucsense]KAF7732190.1 Uncharacterized protein PECH_001910 [Penicillium ucsense]
MKKETAAAKRKADIMSSSATVNVNFNVHVSNSGNFEIQPAQPAEPATKKAKAASKQPATKKRAPPVIDSTTSTATSSRPKQTARKSTNASPAVSDTWASPGKLYLKGTVPNKNKAKTAPTKTTVDKRETARPRSSIGAQTKTTSGGPVRQQAGYSRQLDEDAPQPYSEQDPIPSTSQNTELPMPTRVPTGRIGLLNGRYDVTCQFVQDLWGCSNDFLSLVATLDGNTLWLNFDLGVARGMIKVQRPYMVNYQYPVRVFWRGSALSQETMESERQLVDSDDRGGVSNGLYFLGDGHIKGFIQYRCREHARDQTLNFDAYR